MEAEDAAAARIWLQQIGEAGFDSGGLIAERQRAAWGGKRFGNALAVFLGLDFDAGEGGALFLGFDDAGSLTVHEKQVIRLAVAMP